MTISQEQSSRSFLQLFIAYLGDYCMRVNQLEHPVEVKYPDSMCFDIDKKANLSAVAN